MTPAPLPKSKMVICTHEFSPFRGGVAIYSEELAAALHRAGVAVEVWAPDCGAPGTVDGFGFPVVRLPAGGSLGFGDLVRFGVQVATRRKQLEEATVVLM